MPESEKKAEIADASSDAENHREAETTKDSVLSDIPLPFDTSKLTEDQKRMAAGWGLDIDKMAEWFFTVELRFDAIQKALPKQMQRALEVVIANKEKERLEAIQKMRTAQGTGGAQRGGGMGDLETLLRMGMGGGGEPSASDKFLMDMGKENLYMGREMMRAFVKEAMPAAFERMRKKGIIKEL